MRRIRNGLLLVLLFCMAQLPAQELNNQDSLSDRAGITFSRDIELYPLPDLQHLLLFNSSLNDLQGHYIRSGIALDRESFFIEGMPVRNSVYLPDMGVLGITMNSLGSLQQGYSPGGSLNYHPLYVSSQSLGRYEFRTNGNSIKGSVIYFLSIRPAGKKRRPLEVYLNANIVNSKDDGPSFVPKIHMKESTRESLGQSVFNPETAGMNSQFSTSYVRAGQMEKSLFAENAKRFNTRIYGKLSIPVGERMDVKFQALVSEQKGRQDVFENRFFNAMNNPDYQHSYSDAKVSFTHRLTEREGLKVSYSLDAGYDYLGVIQSNKAMGKDFFRYSYIGSYTETMMPAYSLQTAGGYNTYTLEGFETTGADFSPGGMNPGLEKYVLWMEEQESDPYRFMLMYSNGYLPPNTMAGWANYDVPVNRYTQSQDSRSYLEGFSDIESRVGNFRIGFEYRRDVSRYYSISTNRLLTQMSALVNSHISALDYDHPQEYYLEGDRYIMYSRLADLNAQTTFDRNLRLAMGLSPDGSDYIQLNSYDYSTGMISYTDESYHSLSMKLGGDPFSLDMFGPEDLYDVVDYYGYDWTMKGIRPSHDALSLLTDGAQNPYSPISQAVWLDYSKSTDKLKINGGVRLERFDARQPVLKDPLSLYPIKTVAETPELNHLAFAHPDWLVYQYTTSETELYYRKGSEWFDANGASLGSDPGVPFGLFPILENIGAYGLQKKAYTDCTPSFTLLPALNLTYSLNSRFMAMLDYSSYTRNPIHNRFNSLDYHRNSITSNLVLENPALKPERFDRLMIGGGYAGQHWLSVALNAEILWYSRAIEMSKINFAYPHSYTTYLNRSEVIRIPDAVLKMNYSNRSWDAGFHFTHYFLDKGLNLTDAGKKYTLGVYTTISPDLLSLYSSFKCHGSFEGLSFSGTWRYRSGTSYAERNNYLLTNKIKWISASNDLALKVRYMYSIRNEILLEVYAQVTNLLNSKTLYAVYPNTGKPNDDGALSDPKNQAYIHAMADSQAFVDQYALYLNKPSTYGQPRIFWFGIVCQVLK